MKCRESSTANITSGLSGKRSESESGKLPRDITALQYLRIRLQTLDWLDWTAIAIFLVFEAATVRAFLSTNFR